AADIYTLSLHDALPILDPCKPFGERGLQTRAQDTILPHTKHANFCNLVLAQILGTQKSLKGRSGTCRTSTLHKSVSFTCGSPGRSEEHTSELQSRVDLV